MIKDQVLKKSLIVFSRSYPKVWYRKIVDWFILKLTKSRWTHVSFAFYDDNSKIYICQEATTPVVTRDNLFSWLMPPDEEYQIFSLNWDFDSFKQVLDNVWQKDKEKPYGILQLITTIFSIIFRTKNFVKKGKVCSEEVLFTLLQEGSPFKKSFEGLNFDLNSVSPEDLYKQILFLEGFGLAKLEESILKEVDF